MSSELPTLQEHVPLAPHCVPLTGLAQRLAQRIQEGGRLGLLTARRIDADGDLALVTLILNPNTASVELWETPLAGQRTYLALTPQIPQAHWFERAIYDLFGVRPEGHPRFKSLLLHEAWPEQFHPLREIHSEPPQENEPRRGYSFLRVKGEGVYEIPVGPIHAGIIEPGHFRFSCLGEIIQNLEIRLGYQHRGVEQRLTEVPWRRARFLAEAASSDTTAANALAHALALEQILGLVPPPLAQDLRACAVEIERTASHIGDLGGICSDIGFTGGATIFGRLRGRALGLGERLTGARLQSAYIFPGGVAHALPDGRDEIRREVEGLIAEFNQSVPLLMDNTGAFERMEGTGAVRPSLARDFGLVGPAGRASGVSYDVRRAFRQEPYAALAWEPADESAGDVLARVQVRVTETRSSLALLRTLFERARHDTPCRVPAADTLPPQRVGVGIVEAWRGELIHLVFTDENGRICRYCIKDPSFNNWTGLAIAARGQLVADFPLCNKSFGLSYSGNDL